MNEELLLSLVQHVEDVLEVVEEEPEEIIEEGLMAVKQEPIPATEYDQSQHFIEERLEIVYETDEQMMVLEEEKESNCPEEYSQQLQYHDLGVSVDVFCPICLISVTYKKEFDNHLLMHLELEGEELACPKCYQVCGSEDELLRHIYTHIAAVFSCPACAYGFQYPNDLLDHARNGCFIEENNTAVKTKRRRVKQDEGDVHPFQCKLCPTVLKDKTNLDRHMFRHTNGRQHRCTICPASFVFATELASHLKYHDPENHKFVCNECDPPRKYFYKRSLLAHTARNHEKRERKEVCTVCDKRFFDQSALKKHELIHTQKSYPCQVCLQKFTRLDHMKQHMKTHNRLGVRSSSARRSSNPLQLRQQVEG